jgi:hypothetical protein
MKTKSMNEAQFLALLQKVLPKATKDTHLATTIYEEVAKEVRLVKSLEAFEKFCAEGALPNLEPETGGGATDGAHWKIRRRQRRPHRR